MSSRRFGIPVAASSHGMKATLRIWTVAAYPLEVIGAGRAATGDSATAE
jgi:hypothetical protein